MSRIPFTALSRSLRIPLVLGAALAAAAAAGGSAWAEESTPAATPNPTDELGYIHVIGATTAGEQLQWVDAAEAAQPEKAELPEINATDWLPTPQD